MALGIRGVDYVSLPVEDLETAVAFYRDVLEVRLVYEIRDRWAEFEVGSLRLALYPRETNEGHGGDLAFLVVGLKRTKNLLERRGVAFPHGVEAFDLPGGRGHLARFRDPSGNRLELVERA